MSTATIAQPTQITFKTDTFLKNKVLEKTRGEGITLKALLTMAMRAYTKGDLKVGTYFSDSKYYDPVFADKDVIAKVNQVSELLKNKEL